jgi:transcriptional regulator with XRE-family HTH domain
MKGLKSFRKRAGYKTQTALAKVLKMNTANISEWEAGNKLPSYQVIKKLFEMGATVEELFGVKCNCGGKPVMQEHDKEFERKVACAIRSMLDCGVKV